MFDRGSAGQMAKQADLVSNFEMQFGDNAAKSPASGLQERCWEIALMEIEGHGDRPCPTKGIDPQTLWKPSAGH